MTSGPPRALWRDRLIITVVYAIAWGPLLVNRGLYWDDWTLLGRTPASLISGFTELGLPLGGIAYSALFSLPWPGLVGHALIFAAYLASSLILHAILRRLPGLSAMDALVAALTFAVLPVNVARIALIDSLYGLSLLAFLAASWLLIRHVQDGGTGSRVAALVLFLLSFYTASLLVFYVVPIAVAAFLLWRPRRTPITTIAVRHADFLALPVAYWILKGAFLTPTGVYEGYNALSVSGLLGVPRAMVAVPSQVLVEPMARAIAVAGWLGLVAGVVVAIGLVRRWAAGDDEHTTPAPVGPGGDRRGADRARHLRVPRGRADAVHLGLDEPTPAPRPARRRAARRGAGPGRHGPRSGGSSGRVGGRGAAPRDRSDRGCPDPRRVPGGLVQAGGADRGGPVRPRAPDCTPHPGR